MNNDLNRMKNDVCANNGVDYPVWAEKSEHNRIWFQDLEGTYVNLETINGPIHPCLTDDILVSIEPKLREGILIKSVVYNPKILLNHRAWALYHAVHHEIRDGLLHQMGIRKLSPYTFEDFYERIGKYVLRAANDIINTTKMRTYEEVRLAIQEKQEFEIRSCYQWIRGLLLDGVYER